MSQTDATARAVEVVNDVDPVAMTNRQAVTSPTVSLVDLIPGAQDLRIKTCSYCHRANGTHTPKCRVSGRGKARICGRCKNILPKHSLGCPKAEPCFYCKKVAPNKCAHHGGIKKTSAEYKREKRLASSPAGPLVAALAEIERSLTRVREEGAKLEQARAALLALR